MSFIIPGIKKVYFSKNERKNRKLFMGLKIIGWVLYESEKMFIKSNTYTSLTLSSDSWAICSISSNSNSSCSVIISTWWPSVPSPLTDRRSLKCSQKFHRFIYFAKMTISVIYECSKENGWKWVKISSNYKAIFTVIFWHIFTLFADFESFFIRDKKDAQNVVFCTILNRWF